MGRYRIVARLGAGGMGRVYLAHSPGGRPVAVKVVRSELAESEDFRRRFAREITAARRVNGAFTAGVVDADPDGSPAWLATTYVPGVSLGDAVAGHGPWTSEPVLALGAALAEALEAIHAAGVVHRDLKPSNILLAVDGPRVIDFGISVAAEVSALTQTGMTIGTPGFMSPEQVIGRPVGPASDTFSLGAVLAYAATGAGPFGTGTAHVLNYRTVHEQPDLSLLPPELHQVVAACLAKQPHQRPTVTTLLHQLTQAGGRDGQADTITPQLNGLDWMPGKVAQLVQKHSSAPPPVTASPPPNRPAAPPPGLTAPGTPPSPPDAVGSTAVTAGNIGQPHQLPYEYLASPTPAPPQYSRAEAVPSRRRTITRTIVTLCIVAAVIIWVATGGIGSLKHLVEGGPSGDTSQQGGPSSGPSQQGGPSSGPSGDTSQQGGPSGDTSQQGGTGTTELVTATATTVKEDGLTMTVTRIENVDGKGQVHLSVLNGTNETVSLFASYFALTDKAGHQYKSNWSSVHWQGDIGPGALEVGTIELEERVPLASGPLRAEFTLIYGYGLGGGSIAVTGIPTR
ncbi:serine/threonine-protein kinase [Streptomyces sp. NPDC059629]|uniref:serine/threonine-protein kinase n=1 Tax=Streptomyces sp. NPDC059629 TaxID=3346889 RepID=UPI0036961AB3